MVQKKGGDITEIFLGILTEKALLHLVSLEKLDINYILIRQGTEENC